MKKISENTDELLQTIIKLKPFKKQELTFKVFHYQVLWEWVWKLIQNH